MEILHAIGNTSMVRLRKVVPADCADIFVKLEWENPTGSFKDRMAQAVIACAEADGRLKPGDTVIEYTGGSTGTSLAFVCAAKGYRIHIVSSDAFSQEKLDHMAASGTHTGSKRGWAHDEETDPRHDRSRAPFEPSAPHLLGRPAPQPGHHRRLLCAGRGDLESEQGRGRRLRALRGNGGVIARRRRGAEAIQREAADRRRRARRIVGTARRCGGPAQDRGCRHRLHAPTLRAKARGRDLGGQHRRCKAMARRLAKEEALFAGTSAGANVVAAIQVARRLGRGAKVVTLMCDSGLT